jgi:hypothetical protein
MLSSATTGPQHVHANTSTGTRDKRSGGVRECFNGSTGLPAATGRLYGTAWHAGSSHAAGGDLKIDFLKVSIGGAGFSGSSLDPRDRGRHDDSRGHCQYSPPVSTALKRFDNAWTKDRS